LIACKYISTVLIGLMIAGGCSKSQTSTDTASRPGGTSLFADTCDKITGVWRGGGFLHRIKKDGKIYSIVGPDSSYAGTCENGMIATGSLAGNATYLQSSDEMIFGGIRYERSSEQAEDRRIEALKAAEDAEKSAEQARMAVEQAQRTEQMRLGMLDQHFVNCWNNNAECDALAQDARAFPQDYDNKKVSFFSQYHIGPSEEAERASRLGPLPR
jgi:hypothetical protein